MAIFRLSIGLAIVLISLVVLSSEQGMNDLVYFEGNLDGKTNKFIHKKDSDCSDCRDVPTELVHTSFNSIVEFLQTLDLFHFIKIKMIFKVLVLGMNFAVPISSGVIEVGKKELSIEDELWRQTCKNVSGIDIDFGRKERLHLEYKNCRNDSINAGQLQQDSLKVLSKVNSTLILEKGALINFAQKYCPKIHTYVACTEIISPIHNECFTATELKDIKFTDDLLLAYTDFFCENNAERVTQFINGNVTECITTKQDELLKCNHEYILSMQNISNPNPLLAMVPMLNAVDKSLDDLKMCVTPIFESCEMSSIAGELIKSLFTSIHTKTLCAEFPNSTAKT